jgi:hypothetical protein
VEEKEVGGNGAEKKEKNDKQTSRSGNAAIKTKKKKNSKKYISHFHSTMQWRNNTLVRSIKEPGH